MDESWRSKYLIFNVQAETQSEHQHENAHCQTDTPIDITSSHVL